MALINPSTLYSGGQGIFDTTPYRVAIQKAQAQKAAQEDALNKYFTELPKTLNDAGTRDQDRPLIDEKVLGLKQYYTQNKDQILKGGAAKYNYEKMIRDASGTIEGSKNAGKDALTRGKAYWNPNMRYLYEDKNMIEKIAKADLPLNHPDYKPFDYTEAPPIKPFDIDKNKKILNLTYKPDETVPLVTNDPSNPMYDIVVQLPVYGQAKRDALRNDALVKMENNTDFKEFIKKQKESPEMNVLLSKTFKEAFGEDMKDDYDVAAAYQYLQLIPPSQKVKRVTDVEATMAKRQEYALAKQREREASINARKANGEVVVEGNALDEFGDGITIGNPKSGLTVTKGYFFTKDGTPKTGEVVVPLDQLPSNLKISLQAGKMLTESQGIILDKYVTLNIVGGEVKSVQTPNGVTSRQGVENLQKAANKEPQKAPQPVFGQKSSTPTAAPKPQGKSTEPPFNMN